MEGAAAGGSAAGVAKSERSAGEGEAARAGSGGAGHAAAPSGAGGAGAAADVHAELLVLGAGPGGYSAAFRGADLGMRTVLVERYPRLGGVCLNVGCIPSKALLHCAEVITAAGELSGRGIEFGAPRIEVPRLAAWKEDVVGRLTRGLAALAQRRGVQVLTGAGEFEAPHRLRLHGAAGSVSIAFEQAIIAAGSHAARLPGLPVGDPRLMDSTDALRLDALPERLLVIGGGIIGLEMASCYHALGARVSVVELEPALLPGCDPDLVAPLQRRLEAQYEAIHLGARVLSVGTRDAALEVAFAGGGAPARARYERVLVAVGRRPNGHRIGAERAGVAVDEAGFIPTDRQQRTNVAHVFAVGDVTGEPMLAHKATHQGKVAAEVAAGRKSGFDARCVPSVVYTDPEVAWTGTSESAAAAEGRELRTATFPWSASGRALATGRPEGLTKLLFDPGSRRLLGAGIVGPHAGELIAEATLAIEMGADAADLALSVHPHPTLSETLLFAAERMEGTVTDLYLPPRKR